MVQPPQYIDVTSRIEHVTVGRSPLLTRRLDQITDQVVHYEAGAPVSPDLTEAEEIAHILEVAGFHKFGRTFDKAGKLYGRTLEYTFGIAPSGRIYILNDPRLVTWSHRNGNFVGVSTLLMLGVGQEPTPVMLETLRRHLDYTASRTDMRVSRRRTWGHGETGPQGPGPDWGNGTPCPGKALAAVRQYREQAIREELMGNGNNANNGSGNNANDGSGSNANNGSGSNTKPAPQVPTGKYTDPVTQQDVHHGFLEFYGRFGSIENGVLLFGRPLSAEMRDVCEDGLERTVQFFERAVFEWHDEVTPGRVMLRRLGAVALHKRGAAGAPAAG